MLSDRRARCSIATRSPCVGSERISPRATQLRTATTPGDATAVKPKPPRFWRQWASRHLACDRRGLGRSKLGNVRCRSNSGTRADIAGGPKSANSGHGRPVAVLSARQAAPSRLECRRTRRGDRMNRRAITVPRRAILLSTIGGLLAPVKVHAQKKPAHWCAAHWLTRHTLCRAAVG